MKKLIIILLLAITLRIVFFVGMGFNDDSSYLYSANEVYSNNFSIGAGWYSSRIGTYLPIVMMWKLFGVSELSSSTYFILCSLIEIISVYFLGKILFSEKVALLAAFILSVLPIGAIYSTQIGPNVPMCAFFAMSLAFYVLAHRDESYKYYSLLSGVSCGIGYLCYESMVLMLPCFLIYTLLNIPRTVKKTVTMFILIVVGFLAIASLRNIYFHHFTGDWFYNEHIISTTLSNDINIDDNFSRYPKALFNIGQDFNSWDDPKLFGITYYIVVLSLIVLLLMNKLFNKNVLFIVISMLFIFLTFQYFLHFISLSIAPQFWRARHSRYLIAMSMPASLIIAYACSCMRGKMAWVGIGAIICLFISSMYYGYNNHKFLRNGMGYVREATYILQRMPEKKIYIPDSWTESKMRVFAKFDEHFLSRLVIYQDAKFDVNKIKDSYIVTDINPYTYICRMNYPPFMANPPQKWKLVETIKMDNYGIFTKFEPRIYSCP